VPLPMPSASGAGQRGGRRWNPNWSSTQTNSTDGNSKILRKNLGLETGCGYEAHHVVQSTDPRAKSSRDLLDKYQIDVNSEYNGIGLTPETHRGKGLQKGPAIREIAWRLDRAVRGIDDWQKARDALIFELAKIKWEIAHGHFPPTSK